MCIRDSPRTELHFPRRRPPRGPICPDAVFLSRIPLQQRSMLHLLHLDWTSLLSRWWGSVAWGHSGCERPFAAGFLGTGWAVAFALLCSLVAEPQTLLLIKLLIALHCGCCGYMALALWLNSPPCKWSGVEWSGVGVVTGIGRQWSFWVLVNSCTLGLWPPVY